MPDLEGHQERINDMRRKVESGEALCMALDCPFVWDIECPHGKWCLSHASDHRMSDSACDAQIAEALCVFVVDGMMPLIKVLSALQRVDTDKMEQKMFPIRVSYTEAVSLSQESNKTVCDVLQDRLNAFTAELRNRYEGDEMPYGLDDESAWQWYKEWLESQTDISG